MKGSKSYKLTKQQQSILYLFYRYRFLDVVTVQKLLHHKLPTRIQSWIKDLTNKGYLHQFYDRTTFYGRTRPALYCLTSRSKQVLENNPSCEKVVLQNLYREKDRTPAFRMHWRTVTEILILFSELYKTGDEKIVYFTRNELISYSHFPQPLPDAFLALTKNNKTIHRYFLELLDETLPRRIIRRKLQRYFTSYQGNWSAETKNTKFPIILLVVANSRHLRKVKKILQQLLDEEYESLKFFITTNEDMHTTSSDTFHWEKVESTLL